MASSQQTRSLASQAVDNKRKAPALEQAHTRRPRNSSEMQRDMAIPFLSSMLYDRMHQFPYSQQSSQLITGNKSSLAIAGHQEERTHRLASVHPEERGPQRDDSMFEFSRSRSHAYSVPNCTTDVCVEDENTVRDVTVGEGSRGVGSRQYVSSCANNVPHNMFGEEDYFKDLGAFFNTSDEQVQLNTIQPTPLTNSTGDIGVSPVDSEDDHGDNARGASRDRQLRANDLEKSKPKTKKIPKLKKKEKLAHKAVDGTKKELNQFNIQPNEEEERVMKNIREKKRRKGVSEKFKELYNLVCASSKKPEQGQGKSGVKTGRVSKSRMLEEAICLIKTMESECSSLLSRNRFLEYQLRQFQQMPQDNAALAKAAGIVPQPIIPFSSHSVNPFIYMAPMPSSMPSTQLPSR